MLHEIHVYQRIPHSPSRISFIIFHPLS